MIIPTMRTLTGGPGFSPLSLGTPLLWLQGNDATWDGSAELGAGVYSSLTNRGSLGGTFDATANAAPIAVNAGGRNVPAFRGTRRVSSSVGVASWPFLHNAAGTATLTARFYLYDTGGTYTALATSAGGAAPGLRLIVTGSKAVAIWSNASADALTLTSVANVAAGWNTVTITKNAAVCEMSLNSETAVTGSISTPSNASPSHVPYLGNDSAGTTAINGLAPEIVIHSTVLDAAGLTAMRSYMGRWSGTPAYSPLQGPADLIQWLVASKGITIATGISAWADQSGYNNDVVQAAAGYQPAFTEDAINGLPGSTGDGSDDFLTLAAFTGGTISQPITRYVVGKINEWVNAKYIVSGFAGNRADVYLNTANTVAPASTAIFGGSGVEVLSTSETGDSLEGKSFVIRARYLTNLSHLRAQYDGSAERATSGDAGTQALSGSNIHSFNGTTQWSATTVCESMIFSGTAGSNTAASDVHDVVLRAKYAVEPA